MAISRGRRDLCFDRYRGRLHDFAWRGRGGGRCLRRRRLFRPTFAIETVLLRDDQRRSFRRDWSRSLAGARRLFTREVSAYLVSQRPSDKQPT